MPYDRATISQCLLNKTSVTRATFKKALKNNKISSKTKRKIFHELNLEYSAKTTLTNALIAKSKVSRSVFYAALKRNLISYKSAITIADNLQIPIESMNF
ncbi:hypothetical protein AAEX28_04250 [Lentisphaerota bacterium WC36G]|nr:hypothetical protein LJT99_07120 [Lentisphaerae bacterium WC36]